MAKEMTLSFEGWSEEANRLLKGRYCIDFEDAGIEKPSLLSNYNMGRRPEEFVEWFAVKYDLTEFQKPIFSSKLQLGDEHSCG